MNGYVRVHSLTHALFSCSANSKVSPATAGCFYVFLSALCLKIVSNNQLPVVVKEHTILIFIGQIINHLGRFLPFVLVFVFESPSPRRRVNPSVIHWSSTRGGRMDGGDSLIKPPALTGAFDKFLHYALSYYHQGLIFYWGHSNSNF